jgi:hypothetical protein
VILKPAPRPLRSEVRKTEKDVPRRPVPEGATDREIRSQTTGRHTMGIIALTLTVFVGIALGDPSGH